MDRQTVENVRANDSGQKKKQHPYAEGRDTELVPSLSKDRKAYQRWYRNQIEHIKGLARSGIVRNHSWMETLVPFIKVLTAGYGQNDDLWIDPSKVAKIEVSGEHADTRENVKITWAHSFVGPQVPARIVRFKLGRKFEQYNQRGVVGEQTNVLINANAVWAVESFGHGTRLYLAQTEAILDQNNSVLVVIPRSSADQNPSPEPIAVAKFLGIELEESRGF